MVITYLQNHFNRSIHFFGQAVLGDVPFGTIAQHAYDGYFIIEHTKGQHFYPGAMDRAVKEILEIGYYHSELISNKILQMVISNDKKSLVSVVENLTENEMTYLQLACTDVVNKQIAEAMDTTERNINFYRLSLCEKFNVKSRIGLVLFVIKHNLINI